MSNLIVIPRTSSSLPFLRKLLEQLESVKEVKTQSTDKILKRKKKIPFATISESSLAKEWLSEEDNAWDKWFTLKNNKRS